MITFNMRAGAVLTCAILFLASVPARTAFPERPVHIVVGFAAGGSVDGAARTIAAKLSEKWGQSVVVDNKTGADGTLAEEFVAHSMPDGETLLFSNENYTINPFIHDGLIYDAVKDFTPIIKTTNIPLVLVVNPTAIPAKNFDEFMSFVRANPGKLNYGSGGPGTSPNLVMQLMMKQTGLNIVSVTYKGMAPAMVALLGNEIQMMFGAVATETAQIKAGNVVPLAVSTKNRAAMLPEIPTVAQAAHLPGFYVDTWTGLLAPAATPNPIVTKIHNDVEAILKQPDVQKILIDQGFEIVGGSSQDLANFIGEDMAKWKSLFQKK